MNQYLKKLLFLLIMLLLFTSCTSLYQPNSLNIPLLQEKGEGTLIVSTGSNIFEVQSAYAITDNYAIMLNYSKANNNDDEQFKQDLGEFAVGYFNKFNESNVTELYFGGGFGKSSSNGFFVLEKIIDTSIKTSSKFYRLFLQTNFGITGKVIESGIALRASYLHFTELEIEDHKNDVSIDSYFVTPAFFFRIGGPIVKFNAQMGYSVMLPNSNTFLFDPVVMSFGLLLRL